MQNNKDSSQKHQNTLKQKIKPHPPIPKQPPKQETKKPGGE